MPRKPKLHVTLAVVVIAVVSAFAVYFSPFGGQWRQTQQAQSYVGLTAEEAEEKTQKDGLKYEETRVDGVNQPQNANFDPKRLNVYVSDGKVTDAYFDSMEHPTPQMPEYIGLSADEAKKKAKQDELIYRDITPRDGVLFTADERKDRVNVTIVDGKVTKAEQY